MFMNDVFPPALTIYFKSRMAGRKAAYDGARDRLANIS